MLEDKYMEIYCSCNRSIVLERENMDELKCKKNL